MSRGASTDTTARPSLSATMPRAAAAPQPGRLAPPPAAAGGGGGQGALPLCPTLTTLLPYNSSISKTPFAVLSAGAASEKTAHTHAHSTHTHTHARTHTHTHTNTHTPVLSVGSAWHCSFLCPFRCSVSLSLQTKTWTPPSPVTYSTLPAHRGLVSAQFTCFTGTKELTLILTYPLAPLPPQALPTPWHQRA